ncbi:MAG TPA: NAD(P)/FAD-dependent oxidoreductase [Candidatus Limnocylindrales bacterium]|nr:NAD(P)/FAD-dependent oxidoreductase [Candidatus Limnocylindrales bacterium]
MRSEGSSVAIIGAGFTGLVAARELASSGHNVTVYERWPDVGGQASAFDLGGDVWIDRYYHHLFPSDRDMIELHEELLPGELEWHHSNVGMYTRGKIWPFSTPRQLLQFGPLPIIDRLRLGAATLALVRRNDWEAMDDTPAFEWLVRSFGRRVVDEVWSPLLLGKFGDEAHSVPLAWLWSKLVLRRKVDGKTIRDERLGYPRNSFQPIARALADEVRKAGGVIELDRTVVSVEGTPGAFTLRCAPPGAYRMPFPGVPVQPGREAHADLVLFTTPTHLTRELAEWPESEDRRLGEWTYRAAAVLLLELRRQFSPTYWINIGDGQVPFLGVIEHTNLVPAERYPARYLYVSNYVSPRDDVLGMSTDELLRSYMPSLQRMSPGFSEADISRAWLFKEGAAQPVPKVGNRKRILPFTSERPGFFLANTTQIYPEDRGTNYSVRLGKLAAKAIAEAKEPVFAPDVTERAELLESA